MWYENVYVDQARVALGVPLSPLWIASSATAIEVGGGRPVQSGHFYVFGSMCAFLASHQTTQRSESGGSPLSTTVAASQTLGRTLKGGNPAAPDIDVGAITPLKEEVVFRISYDTIESIFAEADNSLRIIAHGSVFKFVAMEERSIVLNAVHWLCSNGSTLAGDMDEIQRSIVMYPDASRKVRALATRPEHASEYVLQDIDGAIITNHRLLFSTTVIRLPSIQLMHIGEEDLKIIISNDLILKLRCSQQRQSLVSSVWLASLPIWTDLLDRVHQDPQKALKAHVKILSRLHRQFCAIDVSRDGQLSHGEIQRAIGCLFYNSAFVDGFFQALDADSNGEISLTEFLTGISRLVTSDMIGRIRFSFQMYDRDRSGFLDRDEFYSALQILFSTGDVHAHEDELKSVCDELFELMDTDQSGTISAEEYTDALLYNPQVHRLFRRVGLYDGADYFLLQLAEDPLGIWSPSWGITAAVMQGLLAGLRAKSDAQNLHAQQQQQSPSSHEGTGRSLVPLVPESYLDTKRLFINIAEETLVKYGEPYDPASGGVAVSELEAVDAGGRPGGSTMAVLEVSAPDVFDRIRTLHDIGLKNLKQSLGIDNLVGNMLLGSSTLLRPIDNLFRDRHQFKFVSHDGVFLVRHVTAEEKARLVLQLPQFMSYLLSNPNTLLPRVLAQFSVYCGSRQLHFVLQLNTLRHTDEHRFPICFHAVNNKVPLPPNGVDATDLRAPIELHAGWRDPVLRQAAKDVQYLCSIGMCDYALIAAVTALPQHVNTAVMGRGKIFLEALDSYERSVSTAEKIQETIKKTKSWGCCKGSAVKTSSLQGASSGCASGSMSVDGVDNHQQHQFRSVGSILRDSIGAIPSCRRTWGRSAQQGGIFFSFENGVPGVNQRPVSFVFMNTLCSRPERAYHYGEALLEQLEALIQGADDVVENVNGLGVNGGANRSADTGSRSGGRGSVLRGPGEATITQPLSMMSDTTARMYPVSTDTGRDAHIGVDYAQKMIYIVGSHGQRLLTLNAVLARDLISFTKDLQPYCERHRRRLGLRVGLENKAQGGHREFTRRVDLFFDNIVAKELFLSEARETLSGDGRTGAHVKKLRVFSTTWNVGERPPGDLTDLLRHAIGTSASGCGTDSSSHMERCDIAIVALQDCTFPVPGGVAAATCESFMVYTLGAHFVDYDLVCSSSVWSTRTFVWVHKSLSQHISSICTATTGNFLGNSNAVGVGFKIFDSSLCILNARFAERGDESSSTDSFYDMVEGLSSDLESEGMGPLAAYHHVFFCGDLKYRHRAALHEIIEASRCGSSFLPLSRSDQLVEEMASGASFLGFTEAPLSFRPTNRFLLGTSTGVSAVGGRTNSNMAAASTCCRVYDEWRREHDPPTWSHRILYRSLGHPIDEGSCLAYDACLTIQSSSCAPVFAVHEVSARIQYVVPVVVPPNHPKVVSLRISKLRCDELLQNDICKICDPWVKFFCPFFAELPSATRTLPQRGTVSPFWPGPFVFPVVPCDRALVVSEYFHFVVYDEGSSGKNTLGVATLPLDCLSHHTTKELTLPILLHGRRNGSLSAVVEMVLSTPAGA
jgi:Ca2+-binding EF-hand superfamily protein